MMMKKMGFVMGAAMLACASATYVLAQDDLDNLLNDLEKETKAANASAAKSVAKPKVEVPKAAAKAEEKAEEKPVAKVEEKPAAKEEEKAEEKAEEKPAAKEEEKAEEKVEEKPAAKEEEKAEEKAEEKPAAKEEEKAEEKAEEKPAAKEEEKDEEKAEEKPAAKEEEKAEEKVEEKPVAKEEEKAEEKAEEKPDAKEEEKAEEKAEEKPVAKEEEKAEEKAEEKPDAKEEAKAEEKPEAKEEEKAEEKADPKKVQPIVQKENPDAALIRDIAATEALRRESLDKQAQTELFAARDAMSDGDFEGAFQHYRLADSYLNERVDSRDLKRECAQGMATAKYKSAKQALKEGDREAALKFAQEAEALRHPKAVALIEALGEEPDDDLARDTSSIKHRRNDADYKANRDQYRRRLRLSAQYLATAELDKALEQCELVLKNDPYNREAIALRDRINRRRDIILEKERQATRRGMIADVNAAWRPVYAVNSSELKDVDGGTSKTPLGGDPELSIAQDIEKRMKEMILPTITFKPPATIIDAVDFFRQASRDYDRPETPVDQRGFNFVLKLEKALTGGASAEKPAEDDNSFSSGSEDNAAAAGDSNVPQIPNISASNLSMWDALKLVCDVSGFKFKVERVGVMVMPKDMTTDELVTRSYNVVDSFADRMSSASSDVKDSKGAFDSKKEGEEEGASDEDTERAWKGFFSMMGVSWPKNSRIMYIRTIGKLRVTNTLDQLAILELALNDLNVTPMLIEVETRFVEVAQEDLNSLGFEWLLNSDYSLNMGGKLGKVLGLKNGTWDAKQTSGGYSQTSGTISDVTTMDNTTTTESTTTPNLINTTDTTSSTSVKNTTEQVTTTTENQTWADKMTAGRTWTRGESGGHRNVGVNAINGTDYTTGMRYLNSANSTITASDGSSYNDSFMRVNAFLGNADVSMILHMLSQRSDTDLLSAPKVVTKSGEAATMKVVTKYIYPQDYDVTIQSTSSGSGNSTSSSSGGSDGKILPMVEPQNFQSEEVGVILEVTPEVSSEGQMINLTLNPRIISEPTWKDYGMQVPMSAVMSSTESALRALQSDDLEWFNVPMEQPFFKYRSIETKISLYNGATVVMGGLITEERKSQEDKIPFLGDLPYVGRFFRSRSEWSDKRNLLLFVTARLVDPRGRQMTMGQGDDTTNDTPVTPAPKN